MSCGIKLQIERFRNHLRNLLGERINGGPLITEDRSTDENLGHLHELNVSVLDYTTRIKRNISSLQSLHDKWNSLIGSLEGEARETEEEEFKRFTEGADDYLEMMVSAEDKLAECQTFMAEIDYARKKLRGERADFANCHRNDEQVENDNDVQDTVNPHPAHPAHSAKPIPNWPDWDDQSLTGATRGQNNLHYGSNASMHHPARPENRLKLPKQQLSTFSGDPLNFMSFWDMFSHSVHEHTDLQEIEKFTYLKQCLRGQAANAIAGISVCNANYGIAVNILNEKFGNPDLIKDSLYAQLKQLPQSSASTSTLRSSIDAINAILRQLQAMGESLEQRSILSMVQEKFSENILMELERMKTSYTERWSVDKFMECLMILVNSRENVQRMKNPLLPHESVIEKFGGSSNRGQNFDNRRGAQNTRGFSRGHFNRNFSHGRGNFRDMNFRDRGPKFQSQIYATGSQKTERQKRNCIFCDEEHWDMNCSKYSNSEQRMQRLRDLDKCFKCFKAGHRSQDCRIEMKPCQICGKLHRAALCFQRRGESKPAGMNPSPGQGYGGGQGFGRGQGHGRGRFFRGGNRGNHTNQPTRAPAQPQPIQTESQTPLETPQEMRSAPSTNSEHTPAAPHCTETKAAQVMVMSAKLDVTSIEEPERKASVISFIDSGSDRSFMTKSLARKLGLPIIREEILSVSTFIPGDPSFWQSDIVRMNIVLRNKQIKEVEMSAVETLHVTIRKQPLCKEDREFLMKNEFILENLADEIPIRPTEIGPDILIGADYYCDFISNEDKVQMPSGLYLLPSSLGYIMSGKSHRITEATKYAQAYQYTVSVKTMMNQSIPELNFYDPPNQALIKTVNFEDFWSLESMGITDNPVSNDDDRALKNLNETVKFENGRYSVLWPFIDEEFELPDNKGLAYGRFKSLVNNRFKRDPELLQKYAEIIRDQLDKGIIEVVEEDKQTDTLKHYIPHHPIITPLKNTTKVRIVYDASAKTNRNHKSLNEVMYRGPTLLPDLCSLLLNFRVPKYVITADIEKAFLQLDLQEKHRDVTRFFFLSDPTKATIEDNLTTYRFARVCFGCKASPFLLNAAVKYHLAQQKTDVANKILKGIYVDNVLVGVETEHEATEFYRESKAIFQKASMNLREYTSNNREFIHSLPENDAVKTETSKILGLVWHQNQDTFFIQGSDRVEEENYTTKRKVLHSNASIFDPLGLWGPVVLQAKLFQKKIWELKFDWDETIPEELQEEGKKIASQLQKISDHSVQRRVAESDATFELHTFVDASKKAFGAVSYLKVITESETKCHLIYSKNRLVSKVKEKEISLPRLELMGMVLGTKMIKFISESMSINFSERYLWSDSECCLFWLQTAKPLSVFVANRIQAINELKDVKFNYVRTHENPADLVTRGMDTYELSENELWWKGPSWLTKDEGKWKTEKITVFTPSTVEEAHKEAKSTKPVYETGFYPIQIKEKESFIIDIERFSDHRKLIRTGAFVLRFLKLEIWQKLSPETKENHEYLNSLFRRVETKGILEAEEISNSEKWMELQIQKIEFPEMFANKRFLLKGPMRNLRPFIDRDGLIRSRGRLQESQLEESTKFPILLPKNSEYTKLLVIRFHKDIYCQGVGATLAEIRKKYWIIQGRSVVKKLIKKCIICKMAAQRPYKLPVMANLPEKRITVASPFENTGLDYAGPFKIRINQEEVNVWVVIFTCMVTRAVHLEPALDMSAKQFLNCFRRFISRRGKPEWIYSDNAQQFKLAKGTLDKYWTQIFYDESLLNYFSNEKIRWSFTTEFSPWEGGLYERIVGLMKSALKKAVGRKLLTFNDMWTYLTEVEAVLNSRPLQYVENDLTDHSVLRPIDFCCPNAKLGSPVLSDRDNPDDPDYNPKPQSSDKLKNLWENTQKSLENFWDLWNREYLPSLREKHQLHHRDKKRGISKVPEVDEVVLVQEENPLNRGMWKMGRIVEIFRGRDQEIRSARVVLPNKRIIQRPINLLCPLEIKGKAERGENDVQTHPVRVYCNRIRSPPIRVPRCLLLIVMMAVFFPVTSGNACHKVFMRLQNKN